MRVDGEEKVLKKWLLGITMVVLLAGSGTNTYFYIQQNNRLNQVDERISGLLDNINSVQNGLTSLQGNVSTLGDSIASLSGNIGTLGGKITALEGTTSGLSSDITTLKGNITTINGNITTINGNITSVNYNVTGLQSSVSSMQSSVTTLQSSVSGMQSSVTTLQNSLNNMQGSITALQANDQAVLNVVAKLEPAVVKIVARVSNGYSGGSGVLVRNNGYILTAYHVVQGANSVSVTLKTGEVFSATVVTSDQGLDIAILKLTTSRTDFPVATLGTSATTKVGEDVMAIGFPELFDLPGQASFTKGIVSAMRVDDGSFYANNGEKYIQTDAAINPGNSGGPLVNMKGEVIGIARFVWLFSDSPLIPGDNMGFFIAVEQANSLIVQAAGA